MFWREFRREFCYKPRIVTANNPAASRIKVSRGETACNQIAFFAFQKSSQGQTTKQPRMRL